MTDAEKAAKHAARNRDYYEKNREAINARHRAYYLKHSEEILAQQREKRAAERRAQGIEPRVILTPEERKARKRERNKLWKKQHREKVNAAQREYYAKTRPPKPAKPEKPPKQEKPPKPVKQAKPKESQKKQPKPPKAVQPKPPKQQLQKVQRPPQEPKKTTGKGKAITVRDETRYRMIQAMLARRERLKNTPRCPICGDYQTSTTLIRVCSTCGSRIAAK